MWREGGLREWRWQNIGVLVLIVTAHVFLLRVQWLSQINNNDTDVGVFLHFLTLPEPTSQPIVEKPVQLDKSEQPITDSIQPSMPITPQAVITLPANDASDELPTEIRSEIDWREASESVAAEMAKRSSKDAYRSLDSRPAGEAQREKDKKAEIFERPQHYAGETQRFEGGEVITWLNDRCYMTNRPPYSANPRNVGTVCKTLSNTPRSDLFKDLKPNYLRIPVEELPVPKGTQ